jgi:hypothetical protein
MIGEPHFDGNDNFIHRCCKCGHEAPFGFGVSLGRERLGTWYCANHKPQQQTTSTPNDANLPPPSQDRQNDCDCDSTR